MTRVRTECTTRIGSYTAAGILEAQEFVAQDIDIAVCRPASVETPLSIPPPSFQRLGAELARTFEAEKLKSPRSQQLDPIQALSLPCRFPGVGIIQANNLQAASRPYGR